MPCTLKKCRAQIKNLKTEMNTYSKYCPNVFLAKCDEKHEKGEIITLTTKYGKENECEVWNLIYERDGFYYYSITRVDGYNCQERARAKAERYGAIADKASEKSDMYFQKSQDAVAGIPFGQPILVGHHSEGRHRADIRRSDNAMRHSVEEADKAKEYNGKAEYWDRRSEDVNLSLPESIAYYKNKLAEATEYHQGLKSGKYPREHSMSLAYAKKAVNDLQKNLNIAIKLWGETEQQ